MINEGKIQKFMFQLFLADRPPLFHDFQTELLTVAKKIGIKAGQKPAS